MLAELKGPGRVVATVLKSDHRIEMLRYQDASWAVRKNHLLLVLFEPDERDQCFEFFVRLCGLDREAEVRIIFPGHEVRAFRTLRSMANPALN